jgi:DNA-binding CsgD family transcriptional regulator
LNTLNRVFLTSVGKSDIKSHMTVITGKDYHDILDIIYSANHCQDMESLVSTLCQSMIQSFRSECVTFHLIKGLPRRVNVIESRSFKSDYHNIIEDKHYPALYKDGFFQCSPLLKAAISSSDTILKIGNSISIRDWERSNLYNYFILPQHLYWEMFLALRWKNNLEGMMTLWRSRKQKDYQPGDMARAELLAPHVTLAIRNVSTISKINGWRKKLAIDESNSEGLLLLNHKFQPVYSNAKAREICLYLYHSLSSDPVNIEKGEFTVPSFIIKDCTELLNLIKMEAQFVSWPKERIVFAESGKQFRSECALVWKTDNAHSVPNFMVTLSDLSGKNTLESTLQNRFHLSRREIDIIYCIITDMSYEEIAEKLYISKLTVHTHMKNIYRKLGVRNKIELYRCIQSLHPMI